MNADRWNDCEEGWRCIQERQQAAPSSETVTGRDYGYWLWVVVGWAVVIGMVIEGASR